MKKKKLKKINIRAFSRGVYDCLDEVPFVVYNKYTNKNIFVVISVEEGGEKYDLSTEGSIQPKE